MAKIKETKKETKPANAIITVAELAAEYNVEARDIRVLLRANGMKAPAVEAQEGVFGPRAKYQWEDGSKELAEVRKLIEEGIEETADEEEKPAKKAAPKTKGKSKKVVEEPEEEEDDEDEDEE